MHVDVISLFPEFVHALTRCGVTGRAAKQGKLTLKCWNPRDYTHDVHRTVDDRPYGGGPGMVMKADVLCETLQAVRQASPESVAKVIYLSPQGLRLDQSQVQQLSQESALILLAGRYEGVDERFIEQAVDLECSIGDYVLSGGELAAMVLIDAMTRLLPGVLGHDESAQQDSFMRGLLDHPHYTRPEYCWGNAKDKGNSGIPSVLKSGNHAAIARWRQKQALGRTWQRRPDLFAQYSLTEDEQDLLDEYCRENGLLSQNINTDLISKN